MQPLSSESKYSCSSINSPCDCGFVVLPSSLLEDYVEDGLTVMSFYNSFSVYLGTKISA